MDISYSRWLALGLISALLLLTEGAIIASLAAPYHRVLFLSIAAASLGIGAALLGPGKGNLRDSALRAVKMGLVIFFVLTLVVSAGWMPHGGAQTVMAVGSISMLLVPQMYLQLVLSNRLLSATIPRA